MAGFYDPDSDPSPLGGGESTIGADVNPRDLVAARDAARVRDHRGPVAYYTFLPTRPPPLALEADLPVEEFDPTRGDPGVEHTRRVVLRHTAPAEGEWSSLGIHWRSEMETVVPVHGEVIITEVGVEPDELAAFVPGGSLDRGRLHLEAEVASGANVHATPESLCVLDISDLMSQALWGPALVAIHATNKLHLREHSKPSRLFELRRPIRLAAGRNLVLYVEHPSGPRDEQVTFALVAVLRYFQR